MHQIPTSRLLFVLVFAHSSFAAASNQTDTAALVKLAGDAGNAYAARDLATLKQITADDYVQIDVRGRSLNRTQWLDFVENRKAELTVESDDIRVLYYGQAAVVTGHWTYTKKDGDKEVVTYSRWTSVWTRYPDGWKRHAFQNTYINAQADQCAATSSH